MNDQTTSESRARSIRVLIGKPGLDGHDVGAKLVGRALVDAGMQVTYTGLRQAPTAIAEKAAQHEADVVGLSILSGTHMRLVAEVLQCLQSGGLDDVVVIVGGNIPASDRGQLLEMGVAEVVPTGAEFDEIVQFLERSVQP
jgi:methylmalonyl-CoA mutase C-terminal domain/subunit